MKIARKTAVRRMEQLRREMSKPEYQHKAINVIAAGLAEAMQRNSKGNEV